MAAGDVTITVIGNLTDDPELRFTPSGAAVAKFRIASTPRILDRQTNEWKDGEPLFLACNIWRQAAEYENRPKAAALRKPKKKVNPLDKEGITYIDYKDTALLRKFISDRGKIRARRVTGVSSQQQRQIARAVKNAREMALLAYTTTGR